MSLRVYPEPRRVPHPRVVRVGSYALVSQILVSFLLVVPRPANSPWDISIICVCPTPIANVNFPHVHQPTQDLPRVSLLYVLRTGVFWCGQAEPLASKFSRSEVPNPSPESLADGFSFCGCTDRDPNCSSTSGCGVPERLG